MKTKTVETEIPESMEELQAQAEELRLEVQGAEGLTDTERSDDHQLAFGVRAAFVLLRDAGKTGKMDAAHMACMIAAYIKSAEDKR